MSAAQRDGLSAGDFIPALFDEEPRFPDPELARRLYQNLLGLWDLAGQEGTLRLDAPGGPLGRRAKELPPPPKPAPYGEKGPDESFVESAWRHLDGLDPRQLQRLEHSFENRQDAVLSELDASGLSDEGFAFARQALFELFAIIELGYPPAPRSMTASTPEALLSYAENALVEAELESDQDLRRALREGLDQLWRSRRSR